MHSHTSRRQASPLKDGSTGSAHLPIPAVEDDTGMIRQRPTQERSHEVIRIGHLAVTPGDPRILIRDDPLFLSAQELKLLELLAGSVGRLVSIGTLAKQLARDHKPMTRTGVSVHIHRLRMRLQSAGVRIRTLRGFGYLLEAADAQVS